MLCASLLVLILGGAEVLVEIELGQASLASGRTRRAALSRERDTKTLLHYLNLATKALKLIDDLLSLSGVT